MAFLDKLCRPWLNTLQITGFFLYRKNLLIFVIPYAVLQTGIQSWQNYGGSVVQINTSENNMALLGMLCLRLSDCLSTIVLYGITWRSSGTVISSLKALDKLFSRYLSRQDKWLISAIVTLWATLWVVFVGLRVNNWPFQATLDAINRPFYVKTLPKPVLLSLSYLLIGFIHLDTLGKTALHSFIILLALVLSGISHRLKRKLEKVTDQKELLVAKAECEILWSTTKQLDGCCSTISFLLCFNLIGFLVYDSFLLGRTLSLTQNIAQCAFDLTMICYRLLLFGTHLRVFAMLTEKDQTLLATLKNSFCSRSQVQEEKEAQLEDKLNATTYTIGGLIMTRESALGAMTGILGYIFLYAESAGKDTSEYSHIPSSGLTGNHT